MEIKGVDEILAKMAKLENKAIRNAMRRALRKGAKPMRDAARANAKQIDDPETREQIAKNIAIAAAGAKREQEAGGPMVRVGVQGGARPTSGDNGAPGGNTTYWRFVEFGTSKMKAEPFLRPAGASKAGEALEITSAAMQTELDKELAKL